MLRDARCFLRSACSPGLFAWLTRRRRARAWRSQSMAAPASSGACRSALRSLGAPDTPAPCSLGGLEPSLLFDGPGAFSVAEGDESAAGYELGEAAMGSSGLFAPQRPGVTTQRGGAPTRQRTPTVRHAPASLAGAGGRRLAPPGVQTYVAPTAAKSANASSAALMPPPPPRASARAVAAPAPAAGPAALSRCVRMLRQRLAQRRCIAPLLTLSSCVGRRTRKLAPRRAVARPAPT